MDLDLWDCFGWEKLFFCFQRNTVVWPHLKVFWQGKDDLLDTVKKSKCRLLQFLFSALRVNTVC